jgi:UDP-3-O-[3-hydroxymyristoyl] glucosamine N-acyltransferase
MILGIHLKELLAATGGEFFGNENIELRRIVPLTCEAVTGDVVFSGSHAELPLSTRGASLAIVRVRPAHAQNHIICKNPRLVVAALSWRFKPDLMPDYPEGLFSVVGGDAMAFERGSGGEPCLLRQLGGVVVGRRVKLGSFVNIDRGSLNTMNTEIGDDVVIGSHVHIAHNVKVGARVAIMDHACICGSVEIGEDSWIGPRVVVSDHVKIGRGAHVGIGSVVVEDVPDHKRVMSRPGLIYL